MANILLGWEAGAMEPQGGGDHPPETDRARLRALAALPRPVSAAAAGRDRQRLVNGSR
jgi:hypothetical protein